MKKLILAIFVICSTYAHCQITITQAEMPYAGDELYRTRANNNPFLNYGATGPNHNWDFSNLTASTQDSAIYQTVASTNFVYALVYADIFFNPNRANHARPGTDIPFSNLLQLDNPYTFFYRSSSIYKKVGYGAELAGIPIPITYSNHDEIYSLPIDYGNTDSTFSSYSISIPNFAYYGYEQIRMNDVDGWGSITTPHGTYDALRVKTTLIGKDTVQLDTLSIGFTIDRPIVREYKWLSTGIRVPIMQVNTSEIFGLEIITDIFFYDDPRTITVIQPLANILCPGQSVQINYNATGAFNPGGFLSQPNIFRAQLSDSTGSFTSPINIGSVTSQVSGVINATIPANTIPASGYRIRVISTNPGFTGEDNGFDITIGQPPVAVITAAGTTTFCEGDSVILNAGSDPLYSYQWLLDGIEINGAIDSALTVLNTGSYNVVITNVCGVDASPAISVLVNELPEHTFAQAVYNSCNGAGVLISAQNSTSLTTLNYQWFLDNVVMPGETDSDISANIAGDYTLFVTDTLSGCSFIAGPVSLTSDVVAEPVITASGNQVFCEGDSTILSVIPEPGITYQWLIDGAVISGATGNELTAVTSGNYTVIASGANGCTAVSLTGISITVNPLPGMPVITSNGATTFCDGDSVLLEIGAVGGNTYQWMLDGNLIVGAIDPEYTAIIGGDYSVFATSQDGCTGPESSVVTVVINALPDAPVLNSTGATTFCAGGSVILDFVADSLYSYQWTLDGNIISGANGSGYTASSTGSYGVIATTVNGCTSSAFPEITVTVDPLPIQPVITSSTSTTFCQGDSVALEFIPEPGVTYQWQLNGLDIVGETNSSLIVTDAGIYSVIVVSSTGCTNTSAASIDVVVNPLPAAPVITPNSNTTYCEGGSVTLEVPLVSGYTYQWTLANNNIAGATNNQYTVTDISGLYSVNVADSNGCATSATIPVQVTVNPLPAAPVITQSYDTLFASGPGPFQWYLNGSLIPGATGAFYVVTVNGDYTVMVSDSNSCENISIIFPFNSVGISEHQVTVLNIYPNPSSAIFNINMAVFNQEIKWEVTDITGRIVRKSVSHDSNFIIDLNNESAGLYFLIIADENNNENYKLIKQ